MQFKNQRWEKGRAISGLVLLMGLSFSWALGAGRAASQVAPLVVTDISGKHFDLSKSRNRATVLVFVAHDCPISNGYAPEINRIFADYRARGVAFFVVYADSDLSAASASQHARQFGYAMPLLRDPRHQLSASMGASVTPEAVVFSSAGKRLYLGRVDDRYVTWGKKRSQIAHHDLRDALDAVLSGKPVAQPVSRAVGCFIPGAEK